MTLTRPPTIHYAFGSEAAGPNINAIPDGPTGSYLASWRQGFPPVTMTPLAGGGSPPVGADFNGVLNSLSKGQQWRDAGMPPVFDATLAAAVGGYPVGATLTLNDGYTVVRCNIANTTNDPNAGLWEGCGWAAVDNGASGAISGYASSSSTPVMAGLGSTFLIRTVRSKQALLTVNFMLSNTTAGKSVTVRLYTGVGTPPSAGAAPTGTLLLPKAYTFGSNSAGPYPSCLIGRAVACTPGVWQWVDLSVVTDAGGTAILSDISFAAIEA